MCTLTAITDNETYRMAMNRDEKITRAAGAPPEIYEFDRARAIYPGDGSGGTWFAVNDYGISLGLLNWSDVPRRAIAQVKTRSRGRVIPSLIGSRSLSDLHEVISVSSFQGMLPFRLVGVFPFEQLIWEWRWDSKRFTAQVHAWESRHWFSSSLSDKWAERLRGTVCRKAQREPDFGSVPWLRRMHASHVGGPGPFSLCVHRDDVQTLSYTEVTVTSGRIEMSHFRGRPCDMVDTDTKGTDRNGNASSIVSEVSEAQCLLSSRASSAEQDDQPARYDERPAYMDRSRRKRGEEDEIGNLKYNEQRRDVHPRNARELDRSQVERCAVNGEENAACENERDPRRQRRMMQGNSNNGITRCFKNCSGKTEQENLHAQCSQSHK